MCDYVNGSSRGPNYVVAPTVNEFGFVQRHCKYFIFTYCVYMTKVHKFVVAVHCMDVVADFIDRGLYYTGPFKLSMLHVTYVIVHAGPVPCYLGCYPWHHLPLDLMTTHDAYAT